MRRLLLSLALGQAICGAQPFIYLHAVSNAASSLPFGIPAGTIAQGSIFSIYGRNIGPATGVQASSFPLSNTLGNVSVTVTDGITMLNAIPIYVSASQVNAIMPSNAPTGTVSVRVAVNNARSNSVPVRVGTNSLGLFTVRGTGAGPGVIFNFVSQANQPLNSLQTPAKPGQIVTLWGTGLGPLQAALTPDNSTLVVTSYNQGITFIDTATNTVSKTLFTNGNVFPSGIAIRNDGLAYVTSLIDANPAVLVLNTATKTILGTISIPAEYPHSVYFTPDGTTALVTCPITNYVFVIDVLTSTVSTAVPIGGPRDVAFNRNGTRAYITSTIFPSAVQVVDLATFQIVDSYPINGDPGYIQISRDGRYLTVMDLDSAKKWSIDLATRNVVTITSVVAGGGLTTLP